MQGAAPRSSQSHTDKIPPNVFDMQEEGQILKLLDYVRRSTLYSDAKSATRDLILDYAVTKDSDVLRQLQETLSEINVTLTGAQTEVLKTAASQKETAAKKMPELRKPALQTGFGFRRQQPTFTISPTSPKIEQTPPIEKTPIAHQPEPTAATPSQIQTPPSPPVSSVGTAEVVPNPPAVQSTPAVPESTPALAKNPNDRIKEIKRLVNEKVGNPVNLIDANNVVGREYMNTLLNAMKLVNGGSEEELKLAMDRLEHAYAKVVQSIASGETVIAMPPKSSAEPHTEAAAEKNADVEKSGYETKEKESPLSERPAQEQPEQKREDAPKIKDAVNPIPIRLVKEPVPQTPPVPPPVQTSAPKEAVAEMVSSDTKGFSLADKLRKEAAEREKQTAVQSAKHEEEVAKAEADPLLRTEVTAGLHQLLSEWKLFKSSGIFGTGPSGYDHPLYKKLAALPMAAVIAGRYEGASPEIKQSLSDYMNGWRYEQGVVHEMGETFERYLRRVINAIITRQKPAPAAT